jgi:hypothetical protein
VTGSRTTGRWQRPMVRRGARYLGGARGGVARAKRVLKPPVNGEAQRNGEQWICEGDSGDGVSLRPSLAQHRLENDGAHGCSRGRCSRRCHWPTRRGRAMCRAS